jgi:hypothetical protein
MDYTMGNHPLWQLFRTVYQFGQKPYVVRGLVIGAGYAWPWLRRVERPVSAELIAFHRHEQMQRLRAVLRKKLWPGKAPAAAQRVPVAEPDGRTEAAR